MAKDAKLGLLAGVMGVVLIAVVYYQKGTAGPPEPKSQVPAAAAPVPAATPVHPPR